MNTYTFRLQPSFYGGWAVWPLTHDSIARVLKGVIIRQLEPDQSGQIVLDLALSRPTHEDALNEIAAAVQELGYTIIEATVSEWARSVVEGILLGLFGGGAAGSAKDGGFAFLTAVIGGIFGLAAGSAIQRRAVVYQVTRSYYGWQLTAIQPQPRTTFSFGTG